MEKVYIVHRHVSYTYPNTEFDDVCDTIDRVFESKDKAVNYIRKEIVRWHDSAIRRKETVDVITDETEWSRPGNRAYFMGVDDNASVSRNLYYTIHKVE